MIITKRILRSRLREAYTHGLNEMSNRGFLEWMDEVVKKQKKKRSYNQTYQN